jgi:succinoglycan biosynthesis protein ExoA
MPEVSVIMPCYNEEKFIGRAIESLVDDYVLKHAEILVIDGLSTDRTVDIVTGFIQRNFPVRWLKNEKRLQCFGLNQGISAARGEIIVRVDAHSFYPEGYVKKLVELLETTGAANVGGVMLPGGETPVQQAIALAMQHPMGVGDAKFHLGNYHGWVDTVYLGAFKKEVFTAVGLYDTRCRTNEDAELNIRIRKSGGKIYLDSSIRVEYLPRESFAQLAVQYFRYGQGRAYTTVKHRLVTSYRQVAPPLLVTGLMGSLLLSFFYPYFLVVWGCYLLALLATAWFAWPRRKISLGIRCLTGAAFFLMHTAWGFGFLAYFIKLPVKNANKSE